MMHENVDVDWLTALDPADVEFARLPDNVLMQLALGTEPNFATLAMGEMGRRGSSQAERTATTLLSSDEADRYLKSAALGVLFDTNRNAALQYLLAHVNTADPYLLQQMMEIMLRHEDFFHAENPAALVPQVLSRLDTISDDDYPRQDVRQLFAELYGRRT